MNVGELKKLLEQYPDDMGVLYKRFSDYDTLEADDIEVVEAVNQQFYHMRAHPTMSPDNQARKQKFLVFPGN